MSLAESEAKLMEILGPKPKQEKHEPAESIPMTLIISVEKWDGDDYVFDREIGRRSMIVTAENLREYDRLRRRMKNVASYIYWQRLPARRYYMVSSHAVDGGYMQVSICKFCGLLYRGWGLHGRTRGQRKPPTTCSWQCESKWDNKKTADRRKRKRQAALKPKQCHHCGETFTPKRKDAIYCSPKCRVYAKRQRDRKED